MSSNCIAETRAAYDSGYISSIYQLSCAAGRISGDSTQIISPGTTSTLQIKSVRFDDPNTPMVDMENNRIMLVNSQKVYHISIHVQAQYPEAIMSTNTLSLMWFDGEVEKELAAIDILSKDNSISNYQLTTLAKSNDQQSNGKNNNYIYAKIRNGGVSNLSITRFRFSAIRCV